MSFWYTYVSSAQVLFVVASAVWAVSAIITDVTIVDIFWGSAFVIASYIAHQNGDGYSVRKDLALMMVAIWGIRLSIHIGVRHLSKFPLQEDWRYKNIRKRFGPSFWWSSFFIVFVLQTFLVTIVALPIFNIHTNPDAQYLTVFDIIGVIVWATGLYFEAVGDYQLSKFLSNPKNKGKLMTKGLWSLTRHPNYFGDACAWWGIFIMNLSLPNGIFYIISPVLMTFLLLKVSGVPLSEVSGKKKAGWGDYCNKTPVFVPKLF